MADLKAQLEAMRAQSKQIQPTGEKVDLKAQLAQMRAKNEAPVEKEGFIKGAVKAIGKSFAEPVVSGYNIAKAAPAISRGIASKIAGDRQGELQAIQESETQLQKSRTLPFLGATKPAFVENAVKDDDLGFAKEVVGRGADIASNVIGGGGVAAVGKQTLKGALKQAVKTGLKEGAIAGGMSGFGTELQQEDSTVGSVLGSTATGTALGATGGAVLGAGGALARKGVVGGIKLAQKPFRSFETRTAEAIDSAIDKGLKPSVKRTAQKSEQYKASAREAFNVINEYKPVLAREGEEAAVRLPENRAEMLDSLQQAKKQLFNEYDNLTRESGELGAKFDPTPILHRLDDISNDKAYNPEIRAYATRLMDEVGELKGENFGVVQERIKDFNSSLAGYYEGRVNKAKAQLDASVASLMREITDTQVSGLTGGNWQGLRNKYGALSAIERDLERQVAVEARKNAAGFFDITDIFTGGDLAAGVVSMNPALIAKGLAGRGAKEYIKWLNDPNRFIKKAFELLNQKPVTKVERVRPRFLPAIAARKTGGPKVGTGPTIQGFAPGELERQAQNRKAGERIFSPGAIKEQPLPEKPRIAGLLPAAKKGASDINQGRPIQVAPSNVEYTGPEKVAGSFKSPQRIIEGKVVQPKYTTLYHGTRTGSLPTSDEFVSLTPSKQQARGFAEVRVLGKNKTQEPTVLQVKVPEGRTKEIEFIPGKIDSQLRQAREAGYEYASYFEPGVKTNRNEKTIVALNPSKLEVVQPKQNAAMVDSAAYRYHMTNPKALEKIKTEGLKPSVGQYGKGVYFSPDIAGTKGWGSEEGSLIRVKKSSLPKDYQEFDEQGWTGKNVPSNMLEVSNDDGKTWVPLTEYQKAAGILPRKKK